LHGDGWGQATAIRNVDGFLDLPASEFDIPM
jgi:hypothetical protein